jgi:hypothetical protein
MRAIQITCDICNDEVPESQVKSLTLHEEVNCSRVDLDDEGGDVKIDYEDVCVPCFDKVIKAFNPENINRTLLAYAPPRVM